MINLDYKFVYANRALLEMWGRTLEQSIGQGLLALGYEPWHAAGSTPEMSYGDGWAGYVHADHRKGLYNAWFSSLQTGTPIVHEFQLRKADGSYQWFCVLGIVERHGGTITATAAPDKGAVFSICLPIKQ